MAKDQNNQLQQEQDLNQLLKIRREKLAALQQAGRDPFHITKYEVTHHSKEIKDHLMNSKVRRSPLRDALWQSASWERHPFATYRIFPETFSAMWQETA